jgi:hypothetical protein
MFVPPRKMSRLLLFALPVPYHTGCPALVNPKPNAVRPDPSTDALMLVVSTNTSAFPLPSALPCPSQSSPAVGWYATGDAIRLLPRIAAVKLVLPVIRKMSKLLPEATADQNGSPLSVRIPVPTCVKPSPNF